MADSQQQMVHRKISTSSTEAPQRRVSVEKKSVSFDQTTAGTSLERQNSQISERDEVFDPNPVIEETSVQEEETLPA